MNAGGSPIPGKTSEGSRRLIDLKNPPRSVQIYSPAGNILERIED
jgi:hypothetical protein